MAETRAKSTRTITPGRLCPVCGGDAAEVLHHQEFVLPEGHPLGSSYYVVACDACGFVFADTTVSQADYDDFYARMSKYQDAATSTGAGESPTDAQRLREVAACIAKQLPNKHARIVDIGCAGGGLLKQMQELGYTHAVGIDPSEVCVANARARRLEAYVASLHRLPDTVSGSDCAVLSHVLEHVQDVGGMLTSVRRTLSPGGLVYVEVPDATRYDEFVAAPFQDFNTEHINHFSMITLKNLMAREGFEFLRGDAKTLEIAENTYYPAIYGFFRVGDASVRAALERDRELRERMARYVEVSNSIMQRIDAHLKSQLRGVDAIVLWGVGQLAMKVLGLPSMRAVKFAACVDANPVNRGLRFRGVPVVTPNDFVDSQHPIVITTLLHHRDIARNIRARGIENRVILLLEEAQ